MPNPVSLENSGQAPADPGLVTTAIDFIQDGGPFMYPIMVVLAVGLAISIERIIYLQITKMRNKKIWNAVYPYVSKGQFRQAMETAKGSNTGIAKIITYGLERSRNAKRHDDVELAMEEGLMEITPRLEARTPYIATLANIATLLGLLGTILGLIQAFTAVASADPAQKADLLSASISVAMNTTAFGLMSAIPLLLLYAFINAMTGKLTDSMEMASVKFLNIFRQATSQQENKQEGA
jgi:biopolymer transport protein ExbB/TolQ